MAVISKRLADFEHISLEVFEKLPKPYGAILNWCRGRLRRLSDLWLGTMTYAVKPHDGELYRYTPNTSFLEPTISDITTRDGMVCC